MSVGGTLAQGGHDVRTAQYTQPSTDLLGCAQKSGAAFTRNVSAAGTLSQVAHNVLTTQYTPPATDLSGYAQKLEQPSQLM